MRGNPRRRRVPTTVAFLCRSDPAEDPRTLDVRRVTNEASTDGFGADEEGEVGAVIGIVDGRGFGVWLR